MRKMILAEALVLTLASSASYAQPGTAVPPPLPSLVSSYLQAVIGYGGEAAGAVQCGLRSKAWGENLHDQIVSLLETHAGSPMPDVAPDGTLKTSAHIPSDAEKEAALAALTRHEQDGVNQASQPYAHQGDPASYCTIIQNMALSNLDDYESGTASLWPSFGD